MWSQFIVLRTTRPVESLIVSYVLSIGSILSIRKESVKSKSLVARASRMSDGEATMRVESQRFDNLEMS